MNMKRKIISVSLSMAMLAGTVPMHYVNAEEMPVTSPTHEVPNFDDVKITGSDYEDSYGSKELYINFNNAELSETEFLTNIKELYVNGNLLDKGLYGWKYDGRFRVVDTDDKLQNAVGEKVETIKIVMLDGKTITYPDSSDQPDLPPSPGDPSNPGDDGNDNPSTPEDDEVVALELGDNLEDGVYTVGFRGLNFNNKNQSSMMEATFDENVKITVKDGKKHIEMLNHTFGEYLLTLGIKTDSGWITADKSDYAGEYAGEIPRNIFEFDIDDLTKTYEAGVLVSMMGGKETDIGQYDKYQKFWLEFKGPIKKEFTKYIEPEVTHQEMQKDQERLVKALIEQGADSNGDGDISADELRDFSPNYGYVDVSGLGLNDVSMLSNLGENILSVDLTGNNLKQLPKNLFYNTKNLESVFLSANKLSTLNPEQFINNPKLRTIIMNRNNILALDKNTFANNPELKEFEMSGNGLRELPEGMFANNSKLEVVYMPNNELESLPDNLFEGTNLNLVSLDSNSLRSLPKSIARPNLEKLYARANQISEIPKELGNSSNLRALDLSGNLVEKLPKKVWTNIADKDTGDILLRDNNIKEVPLKALKGKEFRNIELSMNYLPESMPSEYEAIGVDPKQSDKYYPQKGQFDLEITEEDASITLQNKESLEKLLIWSQIDSDIPTDINGVDEYIDSKGMSAVDLAKEYFVYRINYRVEKKIGDKFEVLEDTVLPDSTEDASITINDPDKKKGDVYRVVKTLSASAGAGDFYRKGTFEKEFVAEKGKEDSDDNVSNEKIYSVPVKLLKAYEEADSMGNGALIQTAKIIERKSDNTAIIFLELDGLDFMNMRGHLLNMWTYPDAVNFDQTKMRRANIIDWKEDKGLSGTGRFPSKMKIVRNKLREDLIGVRVEVDAMKEINGSGQENARLAFDWSKAVDITPDTPGTDTPGTTVKPDISDILDKLKKLDIFNKLDKLDKQDILDKLNKLDKLGLLDKLDISEIFDKIVNPETPDNPDTDIPDNPDTDKPDNSDKDKPNDSDKDKPNDSDKDKPNDSDKDKPNDSDKDKPNNSDKDKPKEPTKKYDSKAVYIDGYEDGTFKPDKNMSRAEVAKVLAYALTSGFDKDKDYINDFKDVNEKAWYSKVLGYMKKIDAIEGYPNGKYGPDKAVSRAEFVKIISMIDGVKESKGNKFKDVDGNHWAKKYIESIAEKGYIIGYPDGTFKADNEITRAEVVAIVNRLLEKKLNSYEDKKDLKTFKDMNKEHWAYWDIIAATNK